MDGQLLRGNSCLYYDETAAVTTYLMHELDRGAIRTLWAYYQTSPEAFSEFLARFYFKYARSVEKQQSSTHREPVHVYWVCQNPSACAVSLCRLMYEGA